jgi:hypothetical protein
MVALLLLVVMVMGGGCHSATPFWYDEQPHFGSDEGHQQNRENTSATNANFQLEIAPSVFAPVRGSDETWNAIERGFSSNVECFVCPASLIFIADADYVLCPDCRVVSRTGAEESKMPASSCVFYQEHRGGVGLGLAPKGRHASSAGSMSHYFREYLPASAVFNVDFHRGLGSSRGSSLWWFGKYIYNNIHIFLRLTFCLFLLKRK